MMNLWSTNENASSHDQRPRRLLLLTISLISDIDPSVEANSSDTSVEFDSQHYLSRLAEQYLHNPELRKAIQDLHEQIDKAMSSNDPTLLVSV